MNIFDILGPVMVGPSSSHTAGAVKIGLAARKLLQESPVSANIFLHGSFASTGVGHGTDKALIAGLLGMKPDNADIPRSFILAGEQGLDFSFSSRTMKDASPNTALLELEGESGKALSLQASSIGGGRIAVDRLNGIPVHFTSDKSTLIIQNRDSPGIAAGVTVLLSEEGVNIASMRIYRDKRGGYAVMAIETDEEIKNILLERLWSIAGITGVTYLSMQD